jgi:hypothetical protein
VEGEIGTLESALRMALWVGFHGEVTLVRVMKCGMCCVVEHADGSRGSVPVRSILAWGMP